MGNIIALNSCKSNTGVTTLSIFLAERLGTLTGKKVLLVDLTENSGMKYVIDNNSSSLRNYNIDNILSYCIDSKVDISNIVSINVTSFTNSDLEMILGTNLKDNLHSNQIKIFLDNVRELYDFVIVDFGTRDISDFMHLITMNFIVTFNKTEDLENISENYFNDKASLILNMSKKINKNFKSLKLTAVPYLDEIEDLKNTGIFNLKRSKELDKIIDLICKECQVAKIKRRLFG